MKIQFLHEFGKYWFSAKYNYFRILSILNHEMVLKNEPGCHFKIEVRDTPIMIKNIDMAISNT